MPGLAAQVGIADRADVEQLQGLVGLAGAAIEVQELRLDHRQAVAAGLGLGETW